MPAFWLRRADVSSLVQFVASKQSQARYWARSFAGWHEYCDVKPNAGHEALARLQVCPVPAMSCPSLRLLKLSSLQARGWVGQILTQNVDRLHSRGGATDVLELHGTTHM